MFLGFFFIVSVNFLLSLTHFSCLPQRNPANNGDNKTYIYQHTFKGCLSKKKNVCLLQKKRRHPQKKYVSPKCRVLNNIVVCVWLWSWPTRFTSCSLPTRFYILGFGRDDQPSVSCHVSPKLGWSRGTWSRMRCEISSLTVDSQEIVNATSCFVYVKHSKSDRYRYHFYLPIMSCSKSAGNTFGNKLFHWITGDNILAQVKQVIKCAFKNIKLKHSRETSMEYFLLDVNQLVVVITPANYIRRSHQLGIPMVDVYAICFLSRVSCRIKPLADTKRQTKQQV